MSTTSPFTDWREARRFRAYALGQLGWTQTAIAEALGVTQSTVSGWFKRAAAGIEGLQNRKPPGRPPKLTVAQRDTLVTLLTQGADAHGFAGDVWTSARVALLITRHFGVTLCDRQVRRLLHAIGWSRQQPVRRATQRDEAAIQQWARERWPTLKKKPNGPGARSCSSMNPASISCPPS